MPNPTPRASGSDTPCDSPRPLPTAATTDFLTRRSLVVGLRDGAEDQAWSHAGTWAYSNQVQEVTSDAGGES